MEGRELAARTAAAALCALALSALGLATARAHSPALPAPASAAHSARTLGASQRTSGRDEGERIAETRAPYPPSLLIRSVRWNFAGARALRKANGSDIWPCTWASDDALYCAWGDGGGFDGNSDSTGRVSLGFARVTGAPRLREPSSYHGKNVWGAPPYAEHRATFGGKVGTLIAVDGVIYGAGSLWTRQNAKDPVDTWEAGTLDRLIWSRNLGATWQIAPWTPRGDLGSFLNFGRDGANAPNGYVYDYYSRPHDLSHVYLKRIATSALERTSGSPLAYQFLAFVSESADAVSWSPREADASPVFMDPANAMGATVVYDAGISRYLMTVGHYPKGTFADASPGRLGVFEAPHPWGPWRTLYYAEDWGHFPARTHGDFLGLTFPVKWISPDGTRLWGVFSGPDGLDAFNVVQARLVVRKPPRRGAHARGQRAPASGRSPELTRCTERFNAVNGSVFMSCPAEDGD